MKKYFAVESAREVVSYLDAGRQSWYTNLSRHGLRDRWRKSNNLYFGKHFDNRFGSNSSAILRTGAQGELDAFAINHYRNIIRNTLALTCDQKPVFDVRAINTDYESLQQAKIGNSILESDYKFKQLGDLLKGAAERAQVYGKGNFFSFWNTAKGKPYSVARVTGPDGEPMLDDEGMPKQKVVYEGDMEDRVLGPFDVYVDQGLEQWNPNWVDARIDHNKFELAAQYPQFADSIVDLPSKYEEVDLNRSTLFTQPDTQTDLTYVHYFFHKRTLACPNGRLLIYCNQDVILYDGPAPKPYDETLPVFRIVPGEIFGTTEGWTDAFDLQGIQEAIDILISIGFTNLQANGIQKLWVPEGANISSSTLSKGLAIIRSPNGMEPKPLQLTANPQDLYNALGFLVKSAETTSGINSVARGDPEHSLKSGIALAYVEAMASRYTSAFQASWAKFNEEVATFRLKTYGEFASTKRIIDFAGKRGSAGIDSFTKQNLSRISRVVVDIGNPLTKTLGGRLEVAQDLKDMGFFKTPQDYITFVETGQWGVLTEDVYDQQINVHQENDLLLQGIPVTAVVGDQNLYHAQKHLALIANPEIRAKAAQGDPAAIKVIQVVTDHVMQHKQNWISQDPFFAIISGEPPAPQPAPPAPPGPAPGGPMPGGSPAGAGPQSPGPPMPSKEAKHGGQALAQAMQPPQATGHIPRLPQNLQPGGAQQAGAARP